MAVLIAKHVTRMQNNNQINCKFIPFSLLLMGIITLLLCLFFNISFFSIFSYDGLNKITINKINNIRWYLFLFSLLLIFCSILSNKFNFFKFIKSNNYVALYVGSFFIIWLIFLLESFLRIIPKNTTQEILNQSIAFKPSSFSVWQLAREQTIIDNNNDLRAIIKNGYRENSNLFNKDLNELRIFFIGGSFVYDIYASFGNSWPELIEKNINRKDINVINAGVPGHRTFDSIGRLLSEIHLLKPDYIFLCHAWNDIKYFRELNPQNSLLEMYPGLINNTHDKKINILNNIFEHSQIFLHLKNIYYYGFLNNFGLEGFENKNIILRDQYDKWGLKQYEINLNTFIDLSRSLNIEPILLTQPRLITKDNYSSVKDKVNYKIQELNHNALNNAFNQCDSIIFDVSKKKNIKVLDLSKEMTGKAIFFKDHVHTTTVGSKKISTLITKYIEKFILVNNNN